MKRARIISAILCILAVLCCCVYYRTKTKGADIEPPSIAAGETPLEVSIDASDEELLQDVSAMDEQDGNVTDSVVIESIRKDTEGEAGDFLITYAAFDRASNCATLTKPLVYTDYTQTHFSLEKPLRFSENESFSLFDYITAEDCIDGDVTPFLTFDGDDALFAGEVQKGIYDCTVSVVNSIGDIATLPLQVEIYEDSYEERSLRPSVELKSYLVYIGQGESFDPAQHIDSVTDGGVKYQIDYGPMVETKNEDGETVPVTEQKASGSPLDWVNISRITVNNSVDSSTPGVYSVIYNYVSEKSGYDCSVNLIVVVEED